LAPKYVQFEDLGAGTHGFKDWRPIQTVIDDGALSLPMRTNPNEQTLTFSLKIKSIAEIDLNHAPPINWDEIEYHELILDLNYDIEWENTITC
jgi:hypothetical protein